MVGGFGVTTAMRVAVVLLMALIAIVPFVLVSAAVWLVFFKMAVTVWQFLAVCLLQFLAYSIFLVFTNWKSDPPVSG